MRQKSKWRLLEDQARSYAIGILGDTFDPKKFENETLHWVKCVQEYQLQRYKRGKAIDHAVTFLGDVFDDSVYENIDHYIQSTFKRQKCPIENCEICKRRPERQDTADPPPTTDHPPTPAWSATDSMRTWDLWKLSDQQKQELFGEFDLKGLLLNMQTEAGFGECWMCKDKVERPCIIIGIHPICCYHLKVLSNLLQLESKKGE